MFCFLQRRGKDKLEASIRTSKSKYRRCCGPLCWIILGFKSVIGELRSLYTYTVNATIKHCILTPGVMVLTILAVNFFAHDSWFLWRWRSAASSAGGGAPCPKLEVTHVWSKTLPKMVAEGSIRMVNVTNDDVLDVIFGFGTGERN